jgi:hypothetical protein
MISVGAINQKNLFEMNNKIMLRKLLRGLDGFSARTSLRKC